jgi:hypothetical protein
VKSIRRNPRLQDLPVFVMLEPDKGLPSAEELTSWGVNQVLGKYRGISAIADEVRKYLEGIREGK